MLLVRLVRLGAMGVSPTAALKYDLTAANVARTPDPWLAEPLVPTGV